MYLSSVVNPSFKSMLLVFWLLTLFGVTAAEAGALRIPVGSNPVTFNKNISSLNELKFRNMVRQTTDFSCGAASLATLLNNSFGLDLEENDLVSGMYRHADSKIVSSRGFSMLEMKKYLETIGMRGRGYRIGIERLKTMKRPGIVLLDIDGYRHFVVLKSVVDEIAYIADPALGHLKLKFSEFIEAWPNRIVFSVFGEDYVEKSQLVDLGYDRKYQDLRDVLFNNASGTNLDFGVRANDLF